MLAWILRFALALEVLLYGSLVSRFYGKTGLVLLLWGVVAVLVVRLLFCGLTFLLTAGGRPSLGAAARLRLWGREYAAFVANYLLVSPFECWWMGDDRLDPARRSPPVILIHGFSCSRAAWWFLRRKLDAAGLNVATLSLEPLYVDIERYLPQLSRRIDAVLAQTGATQVVLIGHSMGGLVARAWLARNGSERVQRLITLGTPHGGSRLAYLAPGRNGRQMEPGNEWLAALNASGPPPVATLTLYCEHDNYVAPSAHLQLPGARRIVLEGIGHLSLLYSGQVAGRLLAELAPASAPRAVAAGEASEASGHEERLCWKR